MITTKVKSFDTVKRYGFLFGPRLGDRDIFVHESAVTRLPNRQKPEPALRPLDIVSYETESDPKHPGRLRARNVTVINPAPRGDYRTHD